MTANGRNGSVDFCTLIHTSVSQSNMQYCYVDQLGDSRIDMDEVGSVIRRNSQNWESINQIKSRQFGQFETNKVLVFSTLDAGHDGKL